MSTPAAPEISAPALNEGQRLLYTFIEPSKTMADLRRNTSWWVPWLLMAVFSLGFAYTLDKKIGWGQVVESQIQANPKTAEKIEKMPADQREKMMNLQVSISRSVGYASPVMSLIFIAIVAAVLLGLFNFGFGAKLTFRQTMGITAYGMLPGMLNTILITVLMFFVEPENFDIKNPVATNIGYFVPSSMTFLKSLLGAFDIFVLWQIFLFAIGISLLSKVKKGTAFAAIFTFYFLLKLAGAGFSS